MTTTRIWLSRMGHPQAAFACSFLAFGVVHRAARLDEGVAGVVK